MHLWEGGRKEWSSLCKLGCVCKWTESKFSSIFIEQYSWNECRNDKNRGYNLCHLCSWRKTYHSPNQSLMISHSDLKKKMLRYYCLNDLGKEKYNYITAERHFELTSNHSFLSSLFPYVLSIKEATNAWWLNSQCRVIRAAWFEWLECICGENWVYFVQHELLWCQDILLFRKQEL